jgi:hypothetical protein
MSLPHWQYFLSIEADLFRCARYVEFDQANYGSYSVEFARIIVTAGAEFDAVAKKICKTIQKTSSPQSINAYRPIIIGRYPRFTDYKLQIPSYKLLIQPWKDWTPTTSPDWWSKGYNMIKHQRDAHFFAANLGNAIQATAGLLIAIVYLYDALYGSFLGVDFALAPKLFDSVEEPLGRLDSGGMTWTCTVLK